MIAPFGEVSQEGLPAQWRQLADVFRRHHETGVATAYQRCAEDLEKWLSTAADTPVTLSEASSLGGYSVDHLGRLIRDGKLENAGRPGAPRIRRADVPIKAGRAVAKATPAAPSSREQIVRSAINAGAG